MSTVYSKLQKARKLLQESKLNKSGKNKYSNYDYFELSDFIPRVNEIFDELGLCSAISFTNDMATLDIYNSEKPEERLTFFSPMAEVELAKVSPIQLRGSQITYFRRYLYLMALEIVENDILEENTGKEEEKKAPVKDKPKNTSGIISEPQAKRLYAMGKGKDTDIIKGILSEMGFKSAKDVTIDKYKEICEMIEAI